jgi:asparagine synthase (glutamine-hydrolysing)
VTVGVYSVGEPDICLRSDPAVEFPIYIYADDVRGFALYSTSLPALLADERVPGPLRPSDVGLSFMLQSGVVPPPRTVFENLFVLSIGDEARVGTRNGRLTIVFDHTSPFLSSKRQVSAQGFPDDLDLLERIATATISRIDQTRPTFLFHSAGKDSNSIALALAEAGWQSKVTLVTHRSGDGFDESAISKDIAKRLGFRHRILEEVGVVESRQKTLAIEFFARMSLPTVDSVTLAFPMYVDQVPELRRANIIDGDCNDFYMMTPLRRIERLALPFAAVASGFASIGRVVGSESWVLPVVRSKAEWFGLFGLSAADARRVFPASVPVYPFWRELSNRRGGMDAIDFKTDVYCSVAYSEIYVRKFRSFADAFDANLILPFANESLVKYFGQLPEECLLDRRSHANKVLLRRLLWRRLGLDSDAIGKKGYTYDNGGFVRRNWSWVRDEILSCALWNSRGIGAVIERLWRSTAGGGRTGIAAERALYRLFLLSGWHNHNQYVRRT